MSSSWGARRLKERETGTERCSGKEGERGGEKRRKVKMKVK